MCSMMPSVRVLLSTCVLSVTADFLKLLGNVVFSERNEAKRVMVKLQRPTMPFAEWEVSSGVVVARPAGAQGKLLQGNHATDRNGILPF